MNRGAGGQFGGKKRKKGGGVGYKSKGAIQGSLPKKKKNVEATPSSSHSTTSSITPLTVRGSKAAAGTAIKAQVDGRSTSAKRPLDDALAAVVSNEVKRSTIATHFVFDYDALPNGRQKLWEGEAGIVQLLVRDLPFPVDPRTVKSVMEEVLECVRQQVEYDPRRKPPGEGKTMGPIPYIGLDTRYARIIADTVEAGLGIRTALANVNAP